MTPLPEKKHELDIKKKAAQWAIFLHEYHSDYSCSAIFINPLPKIFF
jgi:hypothetical protein